MAAVLRFRSDFGIGVYRVVVDDAGDVPFKWVDGERVVATVRRRLDTTFSSVRPDARFVQRTVWDLLDLDGNKLMTSATRKDAAGLGVEKLRTQAALARKEWRR